MRTQLTECNDVSCLSEFDPPPLFMNCMNDNCKYCVYVLQSRKDESIYIGFTNDLKRRVEEHNKGLCESTKDSIPHRIAAYEAYSSEIDARIREKRLKQFKNTYKELMKRINKCLE